MRQSSVIKHIVGKLEFLWADYYTKIFVFGSSVELRTLYIQELPYMNTFCECILKKIGLTNAHFQYNSRKLVNVVEVRFTMMYSSRKLNNKKIITTACNLWRQITCSFQVYGRTNHFCAKSTRKTLFWISRFFSPDQHWRQKLFLPTIFPTALDSMFIWFILNTFH